MPYTTNGTAACAIANSLDTTSTVRTYDAQAYSLHKPDDAQADALEIYYTQVYDTQVTNGATPLPSVTGLPTHNVKSLDEDDPQGWTYCYYWSDHSFPADDILSLYSQTIFDQINRECEVQQSPVAPAQGVYVASFLLDQTTSYVNGQKSKISSQDSTDATSSILVDPVSATASSGQMSQGTQDEAHTGSRLSTTGTTRRGTSTTTSSIKSRHVEDSSTIFTSSSSNAPPSSAEASQTSNGSKGNAIDVQPSDSKLPTPEQVSTSGNSAQISPTNIEDPPGSGDIVSSQTAPQSNSVQIDVLTSLIQEIGQLQSSESIPGLSDTASPAQSLRSTEPSYEIPTSTAPEPASIPASATTFAADSNGHQMVDTHTLKPTESLHQTQGVFFPVDISANASINDGISTQTILMSQSGNGFTSVSDSAVASPAVSAHSLSTASDGRVLNEITAIPPSQLSQYVQVITKLASDYSSAGSSVSLSAMSTSKASDSGVFVINASAMSISGSRSPVATTTSADDVASQTSESALQSSASLPSSDSPAFSSSPSSSSSQAGAMMIRISGVVQMMFAIGMVMWIVL